MTNSKTDGNVIQVLFTMQLADNEEVVRKLKLAIVAENAEPLCLPQVIDDISATKTPIISMNSLSSCKIILYFENESDINCALEEGSGLCYLFDDMRR